MPFGSLGDAEFGTYFIGYSAPPDVTEEMLRNMFIGTGHLKTLSPPADGVLARSRELQPVVEFRVPFVVDRHAVDDVERGAKDSDWQSVKDAAKQIAFAEDRAIFDGYEAAGIAGIRASNSNAAVALPGRCPRVPDLGSAGAQCSAARRGRPPLQSVAPADAYTAVAETTDHGYPIREHIARVVQGGDIIWAPTFDDGLLLTTRGGDYELHLGQDVSIGYLSHDAAQIELYFQESMTFFVQTSEAGVTLTAYPRQAHRPR